MKPIDFNSLSNWFFEPDGIDIRQCSHIYRDALVHAFDRTGIDGIIFCTGGGTIVCESKTHWIHRYDD